MLKKTALFICLSLGFTSLFAQNAAEQRRFEQKAKEILAEASKKIKSYSSLRIEFSYEMENKEQKIKESMQGTLLSKADKFKMEIGGQEFISDGTTIWTFLKDLNEVQINLVANSEEDLNPTAILNSFETNYRSKWIKNETEQGKQLDIIDMIPNDPKAFFKIRIAIDAQTKNLVYSTAYDRNGGTYTYRIKKLTPNVAAPDSQFTFNPKNYPGIEVIDLR